MSKINEVEAFKIIFPNESYNFKVIATILKNFPRFDYEFVEDKDFQKLLFKDEALANQIYLREILYRGIFSSYTGLFRTSKWYEGSALGFIEENVFVFASSLRGLIESLTDIFYSFKHICPSIRENWNTLYLGLSGSLNKKLVNWEAAENDFIHFIYGRKIGKGDNSPKAHVAKTAKDYIDAIENFDTSIKGKVSEAYKLLCELSHPSSTSVLLFNDSPDKLNIKSDWNIMMIAEIIGSTKDIWETLFQYSLNPLLVFLKTMNYCPLEELKIPIMDNVNLTQIPLWQKQYKVILSHKLSSN